MVFVYKKKTALMVLSSFFDFTGRKTTCGSPRFQATARAQSAKYSRQGHQIHERRARLRKETGAPFIKINAQPTITGPPFVSECLFSKFMPKINRNTSPSPSVRRTDSRQLPPPGREQTQTPFSPLWGCTSGFRPRPAPLKRCPTARKI